MAKIDYARAKRRDEARAAAHRSERTDPQVEMALKAWRLGFSCFVCKRPDRHWAKVTQKWALCESCARTTALRINKR